MAPLLISRRSQQASLRELLLPSGPEFSVEPSCQPSSLPFHHTHRNTALRKVTYKGPASVHVPESILSGICLFPRQPLGFMWVPQPKGITFKKNQILPIALTAGLTLKVFLEENISHLWPAGTSVTAPHSQVLQNNMCITFPSSSQMPLLYPEEHRPL